MIGLPKTLGATIIVAPTETNGNGVVLSIFSPCPTSPHQPSQNTIVTLTCVCTLDQTELRLSQILRHMQNHTVRDVAADSPGSPTALPDVFLRHIGLGHGVTCEGLWHMTLLFALLLNPSLASIQIQSAIPETLMTLRRNPVFLHDQVCLSSLFLKRCLAYGIFATKPWRIGSRGGSLD
ncbi:unnamed protein product [Fusarium graminearum]|nr:unnamed protein product [Fusarium graminearum]